MSKLIKIFRLQKEPSDAKNSRSSASYAFQEEQKDIIFKLH